MELIELHRRSFQVQPDDVGAQLGELAGDGCTDAGCAPRDHSTPPVVTHQFVNLAVVHFRSAAGFLLSHPSPDLSFAAAASMPAFISSIARDTSLAV